jgi:hypothetical protein
VTNDLPCLVCGVRNSTLKNKSKNPHGAKQLETHHRIIEWALANAIDPGKFNNAIRPKSRPQAHHRHGYVGIHAVTYPNWCPQDLLSEAFLKAVSDEIAKAPAAKRAKATKNKKA